MRENDLQSKFGKWAKNWAGGASVFELKITKTNLLRFDAVSEHQINCLVSASSSSGFHYKISDSGMGHKPFDSVHFRNMNAFVVIQYYKPRKKEFIMIDIERFIKEKEKSSRKSLTEDRAKEIGVVHNF